MVEQHCVVDSVLLLVFKRNKKKNRNLEVSGEVVHCSVVTGVLEMVIEPSEQQLFWWEFQQISQLLVFLLETNQVGMVFQVDVRGDSDLFKKKIK